MKMYFIELTIFWKIIGIEEILLPKNRQEFKEMFKQLFFKKKTISYIVSELMETDLYNIIR